MRKMELKMTRESSRGRRDPETTEAADVANIPLGQIAPNPHNPRRLFDEEPMRILRESIDKLGILVPITVYKDGQGAGGKPYVILDGERRWRCARDLRLRTVPAIVVERPTEEQNILTMFHIHNVREGWQLMPTALKLHTLMERLRVTNERKLSELTKLRVAQIRRCKILLSYPKTIQNLMLAPQAERMKADFFIELQRIRGPALKERFPPWVERGDLNSTKLVLDKYLNEVIRSVTEFRRLTEVYRASQQLSLTDLFMKELDRFLEEPGVGIDDVQVPGATFAKEAKEVRRSARRLLSQVEELEFEEIASDTETVRLLHRLQKVIRTKLEAALLIGVRDAPSRSRRH